jgi:hypothetical protein
VNVRPGRLVRACGRFEMRAVPAIVADKQEGIAMTIHGQALKAVTNQQQDSESENSLLKELSGLRKSARVTRALLRTLLGIPWWKCRADKATLDWIWADGIRFGNENGRLYAVLPSGPMGDLQHFFVANKVDLGKALYQWEAHRQGGTDNVEEMPKKHMANA